MGWSKCLQTTDDDDATGSQVPREEDVTLGRYLPSTKASRGYYAVLSDRACWGVGSGSWSAVGGKWRAFWGVTLLVCCPKGAVLRRGGLYQTGNGDRCPGTL